MQAKTYQNLTSSKNMQILFFQIPHIKFYLIDFSLD